MPQAVRATRTFSVCVFYFIFRFCYISIYNVLSMCDNFNEKLPRGKQLNGTQNVDFI